MELGRPRKKHLDGTDPNGHNVLTEVVFAADLLHLHFGEAAVETAENIIMLWVLTPLFTTIALLCFLKRGAYIGAVLQSR